MEYTFVVDMDLETEFETANVNISEWPGITVRPAEITPVTDDNGRITNFEFSHSDDYITIKHLEEQLMELREFFVKNNVAFSFDVITTNVDAAGIIEKRTANNDGLWLAISRPIFDKPNKIS